MSSKKIEELQGERDSMDYEITTVMQIFEQLCANHSSPHPDESLCSYSLEPLPVIVSFFLSFLCHYLLYMCHEEILV